MAGSSWRHADGRWHTRLDVMGSDEAAHTPTPSRAEPIPLRAVEVGEWGAGFSRLLVGKRYSSGMCGITGVFHYAEPAQPVAEELLEGMTHSLAHRGPDGHGTWRRPGIGLGHRRLAILDPTEAGHQPMVDDTGRFVLTYNGEVYNFRELRRELQAKGETFRTNTDTEVILVGYRVWGTDVVTRLSGIFAFAVWDTQERTLLLARDPLGVKPLFYSDTGGSFRFGSEPKAILTDPDVDRAMSHEGIDAFLTFGYASAPLTSFAAIRQLLPGQTAVVTRHGVRLGSFWQPTYRQRAVSFEAARAELSTLLDDVCKAQMVSDVPLGAFLSGGLDSIAIARSMARAGLGPVKAITMGFEDRGFDETGRATRAAMALGVEQEVHRVTLDATELLPQLSLHLEDPIADASVLPVYLLCREARKSMTVAMSGDGADELFAGYDTYLATRFARYYRWLPSVLRRRLVRPLAHRIPIGEGKYGLHQVATRFVEGAEEGPGRDHASWRRIFGPELKQRLYARAFREATASLDALEAYACHARVEGRDALTGLLNADARFHLPNDMLVKVDRMSMANGLEVRVPFLDRAVVDFATALPSHFKLRRGYVRKHLLREALRRDIPEEVLRAPKSGFNAPIEPWMHGKLGDLLLDVVHSERDTLSELISIPSVEPLLQQHRQRRGDHAHALFTTLMLGLWVRNRREAWHVRQEWRQVVGFSATTSRD